MYNPTRPQTRPTCSVDVYNILIETALASARRSLPAPNLTYNDLIMIANTACYHFGVKESEALSESRLEEHVAFRDALIHALYASGFTLREIAIAMGIVEVSALYRNRAYKQKLSRKDRGFAGFDKWLRTYLSKN